MRARFRLLEIEEKKPGRELVKTRVTYETERCGDRPHMIADALSLCVHGEAFAHAR
jgi:hypothetical protein